MIRVALPESFSKSAPDRRYPVTLVLDGVWHLRKVAAASDELRERLTEELDYRNEARLQRQFAEHYAGHPSIVVPMPTARP